MMADEYRAREQWHLDKRVPLSLIFAILLQTAGMVWWGATLAGDVRAQADKIAALETENIQRRIEDRGVEKRLATIEGQITYQKDILEDIRAILRQSSRSVNQ